jgi:hypothetical protein
MFGRTSGIRGTLATEVAALAPDVIDAHSVVPLFELYEQIERLAATAKTLLARRVDELEQWKRAGYRSAAEYLATKSGSTVSAAKDTLATSTKLAELPVVEEAMRAGRLSNAQAVVVADAAAAAPSQQSRLVNEAQRSSVAELKSECLRTKAAADPDREATYRRIHVGRFVRTHVDSEGAWHLHARGPADAGARIEAALRSLIDEEFARDRAEDRREQRDALAFDALEHLAATPTDPETTRTPKQPKPRNLMLIGSTSRLCDGARCRTTRCVRSPASVRSRPPSPARCWVSPS